ncbi:hypothetical protein, partial [Marivita sp.]|uniref:hypothetical protein n=1 Tax=Marivita sp. TaxID=2003365 RepID=UPI0026198903
SFQIAGFERQRLHQCHVISANMVRSPDAFAFSGGSFRTLHPRHLCPNNENRADVPARTVISTRNVSIPTALERKVENATLVGRVGEPTIWPNDIAGQQKPEAWQNAKQHALERNPRRERGSDPPNKTHQQRNHDSSRRSDSDSLHRMNHSIETAL